MRVIDNHDTIAAWDQWTETLDQEAKSRMTTSLQILTRHRASPVPIHSYLLARSESESVEKTANGNSHVRTVCTYMRRGWGQLKINEKILERIQKNLIQEFKRTSSKN
jgi:hypothetical protein